MYEEFVAIGGTSKFIAPTLYAKELRRIVAGKNKPIFSDLSALLANPKRKRDSERKEMLAWITKE